MRSFVTESFTHIPGDWQIPDVSYVANHGTQAAEFCSGVRDFTRNEKAQVMECKLAGTGEQAWPGFFSVAHFPLHTLFYGPGLGRPAELHEGLVLGEGYTGGQLSKLHGARLKTG